MFCNNIVWEGRSSRKSYLHEYLDSMLDNVETDVSRDAVCNELRRVC